VSEPRNVPAADFGAPDAAEASSGEAVCFTSGAAAAPFGAGVTHAYLASGRPPPAVAAGISVGALNAAAFWATWHEPEATLAPSPSDGAVAQEEKERAREVRRWARFRAYVSQLTDKTLQPIWDAIPDGSDLVSDLRPLRDPEVPGRLLNDEARARERRHLLVLLLAKWFGRLPIRLSTVANFVRGRVWLKEARDASIVGWFAAAAGVWGRLLTIAALLVVHVAFRPRLVRPVSFHASACRLAFRPLLGWPTWLAATALMLSPLTAALAGVVASRRGVSPLATAGFAVLALVIIVAFVALTASHGRVLRSLGIERGIATDFHLRVAIRRFLAPHAPSEDAAIPVDHREAPRPVIVAAPLQKVFRTAPAGTGHEEPIKGYQVWAREGADLDEALRAALALPPLFDPVRVPGGGNPQWFTPGERVHDDALDLVDGSAVRHNPIPALFEFLRVHPEVRLSADAASPAIHVVHSVPIRRAAGDGRLSEADAGIVRGGAKTLRLVQRTDTDLEVEQTNFVSRLEALRAQLGGPPPPADDPVRVVFSDEIAPDSDVSYRNPLDPSRAEMLAWTAEGCRSTLSVLHRRALEAAGPDGVDCAAFLASHGGRRRHHFPGSCGLPEVCAACTRLLRAPGRRIRIEIPEQPPLWKPSIVFVASGGVFRGSFHIGMIAALTWARVEPDLVVGASVGTIMGAALAKLVTVRRQDGEDKAAAVVAKLVRLFLEVDQKVALTKRLTSAARELGVRLGAAQLSPSDVSRMFRRGVRADPGYAALGAPPAIIDALSTVLLLPPRVAARIVGRLVAGNVTGALASLGASLERHTLPALGIADAVMGSALLERELRRILGPLPEGVRQPFELELYGTTTQLGSEEPVLLGFEPPYLGGLYDLPSACLASSAFPAVFRPRRESEVYPGSGHPDVRYGDGGMFDNLPFLPALRILSLRQRAFCADARAASAAEFLRRRHAAPYLFIAGALNVNPETGEFPGRRGGDLRDVRDRAGSLRENLKIRGFEWSSERVHRQIERLLQAPGLSTLPPALRGEVDDIVDAAVLPVFPVDREHLNPTFAFARSRGLASSRVARSIANGCFETFRALAVGNAEVSPLVARAFVGLADRRPRIAPRLSEDRASDGDASTCPWWTREGGERFDCPFAKNPKPDGVSDPTLVYRTCAHDPLHARRVTFPQ
jgi:predicted acylesterase/phospholipase RssA